MPNRCLCCGVFLFEPFIRCQSCNPPNCFICLPCFCKGSEGGSHQNNHSYSIVRDNFPILEGSNWLASEEEKLLDAVWECGLGNWDDIASAVQTRSKEECEHHYNKFYISNTKPPLPVLPEPEVETDIRTTPFPVRASEDPPRPAPDSWLAVEMAGYMPARSDFNIDHENYVELELQDIDFEQHSDEDEIDEDLKLAVVSIYQSRLRKRARCKWIIREHGLISQKRVLSTMHYYHMAIEGNMLDRLLKFAQFMTADDFNHFMEGLHHEFQLRHKVRMLQECRRMGLTRLRSISVYTKLKQQREEQANRRTALDNVLAHLRDETTCRQWFQKQAWRECVEGLPDLGTHSTVRRTAAPLDITGLPGNERLSAEESKLCSSLRLMPETFLRIKGTLISECARQRGLKLAQARSLIKIDVNKTRRIYDFLMSENLIYKRPDKMFT